LCWFVMNSLCSLLDDEAEFVRSCVFLLLGVSSSYFKEYCSSTSHSSVPKIPCCQELFSPFRCSFSSSHTSNHPTSSCCRHDPHLHLAPSFLSKNSFRPSSLQSKSFAVFSPNLLCELTSSLCRSASFVLQLNLLLISFAAANYHSKQSELSPFFSSFSAVSSSAESHSSSWYRYSSSSCASVVLCSFLSVVRKEMNRLSEKMAEYDTLIKETLSTSSHQHLTFSSFSEAIANDLVRIGHIWTFVRPVMLSSKYLSLSLTHTLSFSLFLSLSFFLSLSYIFI